jgi:hypothetical protein
LSAFIGGQSILLFSYYSPQFLAAQDAEHHQELPADVDFMTALIRD